ncbi:hypothetical protein IG631_23033 [Alternaria alternata]|nr:hypothetical protein IG631_23033 [Alternaria alternata]
MQSSLTIVSIVTATRIPVAQDVTSLASRSEFLCSRSASARCYCADPIHPTKRHISYIWHGSSAVRFTSCLDRTYCRLIRLPRMPLMAHDTIDKGSEAPKMGQ